MNHRFGLNLDCRKNMYLAFYWHTFTNNFRVKKLSSGLKSMTTEHGKPKW